MSGPTAPADRAVPLALASFVVTSMAIALTSGSVGITTIGRSTTTTVHTASGSPAGPTGATSSRL